MSMVVITISVHVKIKLKNTIWLTDDMSCLFIGVNSCISVLHLPSRVEARILERSIVSFGL